MSKLLFNSPKSTSPDRPSEKGQGLVEYSLILVLVAVVVIVILALLGPSIGNVFSNVITNLGGETTASADSGAVAAPTATTAAAAPAPTATTPSIIEGDAARAQYCAERPGYVGGVNWGFAGGHTWTTNGQTYHVTGAPFNCPYP